MIYYAADLECTINEPYQPYLITIKNIEKDEDVRVLYSLDELFDFLKGQDVGLIFHNGESYDFNFIEYYIKKKSNDNYEYINGSNKITITYPNEFVMNKNGKFKIRKGNKVIITTKIKLIDSIKMLPGSIKKFGDILNLPKGKDTPLVTKIEDNKYYTKNKVYTSIPNKWIEYAKRDTLILSEYIKLTNTLTHYRNNVYTIAKASFNDLNTNFGYNKKYIPYFSKARLDGIEKYSKTYNKTLNQFAYKGGIAWTNPKYANTLLEDVDGYYLDYTSMYPSIYMNPEKYPLPSIIPTGNDNDNNLKIYIIEKLRGVCKDGCFPLIKDRTDAFTKFGKTDRVNCDEYHKYINSKEITLTEMEFEYLQECYDFDCESIQVYSYTPNYPLMNALKKYGEHYYYIKENSSGVERETAKLRLNSVYGYLGYFNKEVKQYEYKYNKDEDVIEKILLQKENGESKCSVIGNQNADVLAAAFITAYGRVKLARDINKVGIDNVVCCDTDSLLIIGGRDKVEIANKLGELKEECRFKKIISIKPKTYCLADEFYTPIKQATAGGNYKFKDIRNFVKGTQYLSTEIARGIGGVGIVDVEKTL